MWAHYRKTLIPTQLFIIAMCAGLYFMTRIWLGGIIVLFLAMELGALIGALWAARLKRKIKSSSDSLPLQNRL